MILITVPPLGEQEKNPQRSPEVAIFSTHVAWIEHQTLQRCAGGFLLSRIRFFANQNCEPQKPSREAAAGTTSTPISKIASNQISNTTKAGNLQVGVLQAKRSKQ